MKHVETQILVASEWVLEKKGISGRGQRFPGFQAEGCIVSEKKGLRDLRQDVYQVSCCAGNQDVAKGQNNNSDYSRVFAACDSTGLQKSFILNAEI